MASPFDMICHIDLSSEFAMLKSHVKNVMDTRKRSIRPFAEEAGVSFQTVIRARDDKSIGTCTLDTLTKIAQVLNVEVKDLFSEIKDPPAND